MRFADAVQYALHALAAVRLRSALIVLATAIGTAAVIVLTSLGEGARQYVIDRFASLGSDILIVLPGRSETTGGAPPLLGETPRPLTLADTRAMLRSAWVLRAAPIAAGAAPVSVGARERESPVLGTTSDFFAIRRLAMAQGRFLPPGDMERGGRVCVLGYGLTRELFPAGSALGQRVLVGDRAFRVIGVLAPTGVSIGVDFDEIVLLPVAAAMRLFDTDGLFRVLIQGAPGRPLAAVGAEVRRIVRARHGGEDDITIVTQDAVLRSLGRTLDTLTLAVAGIGGISLVVAGILVMNVMMVAVRQRRHEIGLLAALGAPGRGIALLFLLEAVILAGVGGLTGSLLGLGLVCLLRRLSLFAGFPLAPVPWAVAAAAAVALGTGLLFGWLPARRAARLDPVSALARR